VSVNSSALFGRRGVVGLVITRLVSLIWLVLFGK